MKELITVIIPNYNYGHFIIQSLESVHSQKHKYIEVLIGDDGSSDDSIYKIEQFINTNSSRFDKIELYKLENSGKIGVLNKLLPLANGKYTCILDSDDIILPEFLNIQIDFLTKNKHLSFCFTDAYLIDEKSRIIGEIFSSDFSIDKTLKESYIPANGLTKTKDLKSILPMDENYRTRSKHHKWIKLVKNNKQGYHIKKKLFSYRMHDQNLSKIYQRLKEGKNISSSVKYNFCDYWDSITN